MKLRMKKEKNNYEMNCKIEIQLKKNPFLQFFLSSLPKASG